MTKYKCQPNTLVVVPCFACGRDFMVKYKGYMQSPLCQAYKPGRKGRGYYRVFWCEGCEGGDDVDV